MKPSQWIIGNKCACTCHVLILKSIVVFLIQYTHKTLLNVPNAYTRRKTINILNCIVSVVAELLLFDFGFAVAMLLSLIPFILCEYMCGLCKRMRFDCFLLVYTHIGISLQLWHLKQWADASQVRRGKIEIRKIVHEWTSFVGTSRNESNQKANLKNLTNWWDCWSSKLMENSKLDYKSSYWRISAENSTENLSDIASYAYMIV